LYGQIGKLIPDINCKAGVLHRFTQTKRGLGNSLPIPGHNPCNSAALSRHTLTHRQTDRQRDRQADRPTDRQTDRHTGRQAGRQINGMSHRCTQTQATLTGLPDHTQAAS